MFLYHLSLFDFHQLTRKITFICFCNLCTFFVSIYLHALIHCYDLSYFHHVFNIFSRLVSKENDFESSASSLDTDMEENSCHESESQHYPDPSSSTLIPNPVLIPSRVHDDLHHSVSMTVRDAFIPSDLSHIHLLDQNNSIADPNLNHHNSTLISHPMTNDLSTFHPEQILQFYPDSSSTITPDSSPFVKRSKAMITPNNSTTNFDPNGDITFLYDLVTPPTTNRTAVFDHWNGRMTLPQSPANNSMMDHHHPHPHHSSQHIKQEHYHRKAL